MLRRTLLLLLVVPLGALAQTKPAPADWKPSFAYQLLELSLEATARDIERGGARVGVVQRQALKDVVRMGLLPRLDATGPRPAAS